MSKVVLVSIGFDVNLVMRSLLKIGLSNGDVLLLLYSKSGGEYERKKVEKAVETIKDLVSKTGIGYYDIVVSGFDFVNDVATILNAIKKHSKAHIIASLVGGMRIVIVEAIVSLLLYRKFVNKNVNVTVHVMREDGTYDIMLPLDAMYLPDLSNRELTVLKIIKREELFRKTRAKIVEDLSSKLNVTESMIYKLLSSLERKNILRSKDSTLEPTLLGKIILSIL